MSGTGKPPSPRPPQLPGRVSPRNDLKLPPLPAPRDAGGSASTSPRTGSPPSLMSRSGAALPLLPLSAPPPRSGSPVASPRGGPTTGPTATVSPRVRAPGAAGVRGPVKSGGISPRGPLPKGPPRADGDGSEPSSPRAAPLPATPVRSGDTDGPDYDDMIAMNELTEQSIVRNLRVRYTRAKIYTCIGDIVVSVNPYQPMPQLYAPAVMSAYAAAAAGGAEKLAPHLFSVVATAHHRMVSHKLSQTILATGESGAGKTEATKLIIGFLGNVAHGGAHMHEKMVLSSIVLEAFGNAKTTLNHNSSRFGKYFKVQFSRDDSSITGGAVEHFLLEQSRVSHQSAGERNFHVFYQLCRGVGSQAQRMALALKAPSQYRYLRTCTADLEDAREWGRLCEALTALGVDAHRQQLVWAVLAGILWLGEVSFVLGPAQPDPRNPRVMQPPPLVVSNPEAVATAASLLQVDPNALRDNFERRTVQASGRETFAHVKLTVAEAEEARDTLARAIYARLFDYIVGAINESIAAADDGDGSGGDSEAQLFIGLLDIFGFEKFERNAYSQLLINLGNEQLQNLFVQRIFVLEQQQYAEAGINWVPHAFPNNAACLALLEDMLALLDEDSFLALGSDANFLQKVAQRHGKHPSFALAVKAAADEFCVHHYAGSVTYCAQGFRVANLFTLRPELASVVSASRNLVLSTLFSSVLGGDATSARRGKVSVSKQYRTQLRDLLRLIASTQSHYVRCVRPNTLQVPAQFDDTLVASQLAALGVMATVQVRQSALPHRFAFHDYYRQHRDLANLPEPVVGPHEDAKLKALWLAQLLVLATQLPAAETRQYFAANDTTIYVSEALHSRCEQLRAARMDELERQRLEDERRAREEAARRAREEAERLRAAQEMERRAREAEEARRAEEERARLERERQDAADAARRAEEAARRAEAARLQAAREEQERRRRELEEAQRAALLRAQLAEEERQLAEEERRMRELEEAARRAQAEREALERNRLAAVEAERTLAELRRQAEERAKAEMLKRNRQAKGFFRPAPVDPQLAWKASVVDVELRRSNERSKRAKEPWLRIRVLCGPETWEIEKTPGDFAELSTALQVSERANVRGLLALLELMKKDPGGAAQSYLDFCVTDPVLWNLPVTLQFLLSGLHHVAPVEDWMLKSEHAGQLVKKKGEKSGLQKKLASRWCVIARRTLYYYARKDDLNPRGIIALDGSIVAALQAQDAGASPRRNAKSGPTSFKLIQNDGTNYLFSANDDVDCKKWVDSITAGNQQVQQLAQQTVDGLLEVEIIAARDLQGTLDSGLCNPFVIGYVEGQQIETRQRMGTLHPVWPEALFNSAATHVCSVNDARSLIWFTVWSQDTLGARSTASFVPHSFLGMAVLPVSTLPPNETVDVWIPLAPRSAKEKVSGSLRVALTYRWVPAAPLKSVALLRSSRFFGAPLELLMAHRDNPFPVPVFVAQLVEWFMRHRSVATEADFFQPPHGPEWTRFLQRFEDTVSSTGLFVLADEEDPQHVLGLLYHMLRSLREPLLTFRTFEALMGADASGAGSIEVATLRGALTQLPRHNKAMLGTVIALLRMLVDCSPVNQSSSETVRIGRVVEKRGRAQVRRRITSHLGVTLADVVSAFGPVLMRAPMETERSVLNLIECNGVLEYVVSNSKSLFGGISLLEELVAQVDQCRGLQMSILPAASTTSAGVQSSSPHSLSPRDDVSMTTTFPLSLRHLPPDDSDAEDHSPRTDAPTSPRMPALPLLESSADFFPSSIDVSSGVDSTSPPPDRVIPRAAAVSVPIKVPSKPLPAPDTESDEE